MSDHYEVVFSCHLRDDTPGEVLDWLRWHLGLVEQPPGPIDESDYAVLKPDPDGWLPGAEVGLLRRQLLGELDGTDLYTWGLYSRTLWVDDELGRVNDVLGLIAPHVADDGYVGHFRDIYEAAPTVMAIFDGEPTAFGVGKDD